MESPRRPAEAGWYVLLVLASFLSLFRGFSEFLYVSGAEYSDLTISHLPNFIFLRRALLEYGVVPYWSPAILSGFPFFADPLSGLWYPPGWLAAAWPQPWAFNLLAGLHLFWGGLGLKRLLEEEGLENASAWFGGLAFALLPKLLAHFSAGHIGLVYAVCWTPWLLWAARSEKRGWRRPGILLAVIFLADPRWAAYAGVFWLAFSAAHSQVWAKTGEVLNKTGKWFRQQLPEIALAGALSAPLLLPLLENAARSTRSAMTPGDVLAFSLPPIRLLGLLFPNFGGMVEWKLYPGGVVLTLAAAGLFSAMRLRPTRKSFSGRFWLATAILALVFSFGEQIPILRLWAYLPGANLLRVPPRAMFLFGLALAALGAFGFDHLFSTQQSLEPDEEIRASTDRRRSNLLLAALAFFWLVFPLVVRVVSGSLPLQFAWGTIAGLTSLAAIVILRRYPDAFIPAAAIFVLLIADLTGSNLQSLESRTPEDVFSEGKALASWLSDQTGDFRIYSPSYSLPQHTAAVYGLELADGVDPLQIRSYAEVMERASGVPSHGYSVTLPPFSGKDIAHANALFIPDAGLLGEWNVGFVVSAFDISAKGLELVTEIEGVRVYRNLLVQPRALDKSSGDPVAYRWSPNRIDFDIAGFHGPVRFSLPAYPWWQVLADGQRQGFLKDLDSISYPVGTQKLSVVFTPFSLYLGLSVFLLSFVYLILEHRGKR